MTLPWMKWIATAVVFAAFPLHTSAGEHEFEIHRGEEFTLSEEGPREDIRFVRRFIISREQWEKQPRADPRAKPPLSAAKALELAEASLEPSQSDGDDDVHMTKLELRHRSVGDPHLRELSITYYVVDFHVDGSEVQRLVLMDGTVVKSQLKRLPAKTPDR
jgi:hypothetical protein